MAVAMPDPAILHVEAVCGRLAVSSDCHPVEEMAIVDGWVMAPGVINEQEQ